MIVKRHTAVFGSCALLLLLGVSAPADQREMTVTVETLLGPDATFTDGISIDPQGFLFASDALGAGSISNPQGTTIKMISPDLNVTTFAEGLNVPMDNVLDADGNLYVPNYLGVINKITPQGQVSMYANIPNCAGIEIDSQGNIYVSRPNGSPAANQIWKIGPGGSPVSVYFSGSPLSYSIGLAMDESDNLFVANFAMGHIHKIAADNPSVAEYIASIPDPVPGGNCGFMAYRDGMLYCPGYAQCQVFRVEVVSGEVTLLAGTGVPGRVDGPGETAQFYQPNGIAISATGDTLYITDDVDRTLRIVIIEEETSGVEERAVASTPTLLLTNTPNPFHAQTTISYALPAAERVELGVFDIHGRLVRLLSSGPRDAGLHTITWDGTDGRGRDVNNGLYFYMLGAGAMRLSGGMTLFR